jgi:hypothetical protein
MAGVGGLRRLVWAATLIVGLGGCSADADVVSPAFEPSTSPFQRVFGPAFAPIPPVGEAMRLDGALLARDRRSLVVSFIGGKAYTSTDPCSQDYEAWARLDGDTLDVTVAKLDHPKQAGANEGVVCTMEGYSYVFRILLEPPFAGSKVTAGGSGPMWMPPPDAVAEVPLGPGWQLTALMSEPSINALHRTYQPVPAPTAGADRFMALHQAFGEPTANVIDEPIGNATIHGSVVPVGRNGEDGFAAAWIVGANHFWFTVSDPSLTLDAFVALANGVEVPRP